MKIFGINITFGDPEKRKQKRLDRWGDMALPELKSSLGLRNDKLKDEIYYAWWKEGDNLVKVADWIRRWIPDRELRDVVTVKIADYLKQREIDIELRNDELKRITSELRKRIQ